MRRFAVVLLPLLLAACGDDGRDAVCKAVDDNRASWSKVSRIVAAAERDAQRGAQQPDKADDHQQFREGKPGFFRRMGAHGACEEFIPS